MAEAEEAPANVNRTSALPDDIREALAVENLKTVAGATAFYAAQMHANQVANQQAMNEIMRACTSKCVEAILGTSASESGGDIAALMQIIKAAQTTPPVTP